uniref:Holin n=1 Tax=Aliivibrio phage vB_Alvi_H905 TaxID=3234039 RepID=A0AB39C9X1_9VIRU
MLEKKRLWLTAAASIIAAFFAFKGDRLTTFFGGVTAFFGAFSVNEYGIIFGIVLGICSFALTWYYKEKNHRLLELRLKDKDMTSVSAILAEDDN